MDVTEAVETRLDVREYADDPVDDEIKEAVLEAGRLASSGKNLQHWRFVLVEGEDLSALAEASPSGSWAAGADFAVAICTDTSYDFNRLDAGRALTNMQLVAWERGVASGVYTVDQPDVDELLGVPDGSEVSVVATFGYPAQEIQGIKDREPLEEVASGGSVGEPLDLETS